MKNCIILGSGRSGTSLAAGILSNSGYFQGNNLFKPRISNPKGFFEDPEINTINEKILSNYSSFFPITTNHFRFFKQPRKYGQSWLLRIENPKMKLDNEEINKNILLLVNQEPYCFKDPRFSYTLPVWKQHTQNIAFVVVFRDPATTANSIIKEINTVPYLTDLRNWFTFNHAVEVWLNIYENILKMHSQSEEWLFVHYEQLLDGTGIERLERKLNVKADRNFAEKKFYRSKMEAKLDSKVTNLYNYLLSLAYNTNN